jgi:hypothetical protein
VSQSKTFIFIDYLKYVGTEIESYTLLPVVASNLCHSFFYKIITPISSFIFTLPSSGPLSVLCSYEDSGFLTTNTLIPNKATF